MRFRQFMSIQVALGAYVHISVCLPFANWMHACMDAWMDGYSRWMDPMQAQSSVHWYFLRHCRMSSSSFRWRLCSWWKAVAQIFSVLWPSLLGRWPLARRTRQTTSGYKDQQHEKQHKQNPPYCHNLSHPSSSTSTSNLSSNQKTWRYCTI